MNSVRFLVVMTLVSFATTICPASGQGLFTFDYPFLQERLEPPK